MAKQEYTPPDPNVANHEPAILTFRYTPEQTRLMAEGKLFMLNMTTMVGTTSPNPKNSPPKRS